MQLGTSGGSELNGNLRLNTPAVTNQTPETSLSLSHNHILSQASTLTTTSGTEPSKSPSLFVCLLKMFTIAQI